MAAYGGNAGAGLDGEFDSPPSPPETRRVILRARELVRGIFFVEDNTTTFPSGSYLEQVLNGGLGFQGYNRLLLNRINVDGIQHGYQNLSPAPASRL